MPRNHDANISRSRDKLLFTPGPLSTSQAVKLAMARDLGSRDSEFIAMIKSIRTRLLDVAGVAQDDGWETVLIQGSGTYGVESVIGSTVPPGGKLLVIVNGAYGERMLKMASVLGIDSVALRCSEDAVPTAAEVDRVLHADSAVTNVAIVHCETTTGIMNPVEEIGQVVKQHSKSYFVDSMSAFGAVPLDLVNSGIDFLVSSANKCIEGVPGFSFVIGKRAALARSETWARSLSLDLYGQWKGLDDNGQFRFTPPTHVLLAFEQALSELEAEGGVEGRADRYRRNHDRLVEGMRAMGFREYLPPESQGHIITSFVYPDDPKFSFQDFYDRLNDKGYVIYPGKVSNSPCFRIGHVGRIFESDTLALLAAVRVASDEMGLSLPELQSPANSSR